MVIKSVTKKEATQPYSRPTYLVEMDFELMEELYKHIKPLLKTAAINEDDLMMLDLINAKLKIESMLRQERKE